MPTKSKVEDVIMEEEEEVQSQMFGMVRKMALATIGAAAIAQEEIEALLKRLVERGEIAEQDAKKLLHEMMDKRKARTAKVEEDFTKNIEDVFEKMSVPTKSDFDALSQKITALSKKIDELKKP